MTLDAQGAQLFRAGRTFTCTDLGKVPSGHLCCSRHTDGHVAQDHYAHSFQLETTLIACPDSNQKPKRILWHNRDSSQHTGELMFSEWCW